MKIEKFSVRLSALLDHFSITQSELSRRTGISKSSISHYIKGDWEGKQDVVYTIAQEMGVGEAWLMGYDAPMFPDAPTIPRGFEPLPSMSVIPKVGRVACGTPITAEENLDGYVSVPNYWHATFALTCKGDSMSPRIQDGDLVAIRKQDTVENGQIAAVRIDGESTLKHVYLYPDYIELRPENPAYESIIKIGKAMNDVHIEGVAVGLCRGL